jgi:hypothetical protein
VAERLVEVAEQFTGGRVGLLGQRADIVEVADGTLEDVPCPFGLADQRQGLGPARKYTARRCRPGLPGHRLRRRVS